MAGEMIEDLKIDLVKLSNNQIKNKYEIYNEGKGGKD